jgi:hypothetical protein
MATSLYDLIHISTKTSGALTPARSSDPHKLDQAQLLLHALMEQGWTPEEAQEVLLSALYSLKKEATVYVREDSDELTWKDL